MSTVTEFRAVRQASGTTDTDLFDLRPLRESFNRSASGAMAIFTDSDGTKIGNYPYGQRVQIQHSTDGGGSWATRFEGFAADRVRTDTEGFPALEVRILPYSHLLRRRDVYKTYSSSSISTILQDLIESFTGVTWNASNVSVTNDKTISREFKGERVDEAISYLASISADEEWSVNNSLEFVFQKQSTSSAPGISDTDVIRHDIPDEATVAINRFELFYNSGGSEDRIIVEDLPQQETLKDQLNAARAVEISDSDTLPEITDRDRAEEIARQRLDAKSEITTGTVTVPLGRFNTSVGDVINVTISDANITGEDFRVAAIEYNWQEGETRLTLAENVDFVDDVLVALSDKMVNVRARDADTSVTATQFLDVLSGVTLSLSASATTKTAASDAFIVGQSQTGTGSSDKIGRGVGSTSSLTIESQKATVALLNLCRDLWQGASATDLTHIGVGTDGTAATRADTTLGSAVDRVTVHRFGEGSSAVVFELTAQIPAGGVFGNAVDIKEFGVFDSDSGGNMYARVTFGDAAIDSDTRLKLGLTVTVDTDSDLQGVITTTGQQRLVDLITGDSTAHEPSDMVYGTGTTSATESDTALGSKSHEDTIDSTADRSPGVTDIVEEVLAGDANTTNFAEVGYENAANELLARVTYPALASDVVLVTNYRFQASNA